MLMIIVIIQERYQIFILSNCPGKLWSSVSVRLSEWFTYSCFNGNTSNIWLALNLIQSYIHTMVFVDNIVLWMVYQIRPDMVITYPDSLTRDSSTPVNKNVVLLFIVISKFMAPYLFIFHHDERAIFQFHFYAFIHSHRFSSCIFHSHGAIISNIQMWAIL